MATEKELLEQSQKAIADYFELSKYLFGDDAPMDMNEIPEDNKFYQTARVIADDMGVSWEKMTHDESNRLMLNLLSEYFYSIKTDDKYKVMLGISFRKAE